jgi:predicted nucleotidyltransferase
MEKTEILNIMKNSKPELASRYGVSELGLFGSFVRHQENLSSDIDILVSFDRDIDLFDFVDLRELLEKKLSSKVDLVMVSALKPVIGKRILEEVVYV